MPGANYAGFCGTSYENFATNAAIEKTVNYYQETPEVPGIEKPDPWLFPTPGLAAFGASPAVPSGRARGKITWNGGAWAVVGTAFCFITPQGAFIALGTVIDDGLPVTMAGSKPTTSVVNGQLAIASGGLLYIYSGILPMFGEVTVVFSPDPGTSLAVLVSGDSFIHAMVGGVIGVGGANYAIVAQSGNTLVLETAPASGNYSYQFPALAPGGNFTQVPSDPINGPLFGADYVTWLDGYFVVLQRALSQFQLSALGDGTIWSALSVSGALGQADGIQAIMANQEYLYLVGALRAEIWYNAGGALFPFAIEAGAFIEDGIGANNSLVKSHDSLYWLDQSERGAVSAVRSEGLITRRISTHSQERQWANQDPAKGKVYSTVADCVTYSFIWNGHTFIKWIFPTADASWLYDATESDKVGYPVWTESTWTDGNGAPHACLERDHCYAYGQHIVGSGGAEGTPGVLYVLSDSAYYDVPNIGSGPDPLGFPIVRDRIVRLPWAGGLKQFLDRLEFFIQTGVGLDSGQGSNPKMLIRISRDGGKTWGREKSLPMGAGGKYYERVIANPLGSYRDGAIWIRISEPVFAALIGAQHYIRTGGS